MELASDIPRRTEANKKITNFNEIQEKFTNLQIELTMNNKTLKDFLEIIKKKNILTL